MTLKFDFSKVDVCIYHKNCNDGFCAAYVLYSHLKSIGRKTSSVEFIAASHTDKSIDEIVDKIEGKSVLIVDFSYDKETLLEMASIASDILVVDHHKTAMDDLKDLSFAVFDMSKSGAGLLWDLINGPDSRMRLINIVEDRDLWKWEVPCSREITRYINLLPYDFEVWDKLAADLETTSGFLDITDKSFLLTEYHNALVKNVGDYSRLAELHIDNVCVKVRLITVGVKGLISDSCDYVLQNTDDVDVVCCYTVLPTGDISVSVRSRPSFDSSFISKSFGGGGHAQSSGFGRKKKDGFPWVLIERENSDFNV